jgi:hypothetical protein
VTDSRRKYSSGERNIYNGRIMGEGCQGWTPKWQALVHYIHNPFLVPEAPVR